MYKVSINVVIILALGVIGHFIFNVENSSILIPAKENDRDRWGLIDFKGNYVVENEWFNMPSVSSDGIVKVKNKDGLYEFFIADKIPKKIGSEYKYATNFFQGLAAVVKNNGPITYIDKNGIEILRLEKVNGEEVVESGAFSGGLAKFKNSKNKWGFVDRSGQLVVEPKYDELKMFREGLSMFVVNVDNKKLTGFIDKNGNEIISAREIEGVHWGNGLIGFVDEYGDYGILNYKGEKIKKFDKSIKDINVIYSDGKSFVFGDGEEYGLMNKDGEVVIRAKYDAMAFNDDVVMVVDRGLIGYLNKKGEEIIRPKYDIGTLFNKKFAIVKDGSKYVVIDRNNKEISKNVFISIGDVSEIHMNILYNFDPRETVNTDFFDVEGFVNNIILKMPTGQYVTIPEFIKNNNIDEDEIEPYNNSYVISQKYSEFVEFSIEYNFNHSLKGPSYETGVRNGYEYMDKNGYEIDQDGYLESMVIDIGLNGLAKNKTDLIISSLVEELNNNELKVKNERSGIRIYSKEDELIYIIVKTKNGIHIGYILGPTIVKKWETVKN